jgi:hypothetical protein
VNSASLIGAFLLISTTTGTGDLIVYSATYAPTLEQSEYTAHTNYTIATPDDKVVRHVANATGSFASRPARVSLPPGEYYVRAQYEGGRFVTVRIVIEPGKTTVLDLEGEASKQASATKTTRATETAPAIKTTPATESAKQIIRLPNGNAVGWVATGPPG